MTATAGTPPASRPTPAIPTGRVDHQVRGDHGSATDRSVRGTTAPTGSARAAASEARSGVRFTMATSAAPARARDSTTARAAPPAPMTTQRRPEGSKPAPRRREATKPSPSVLVPVSEPSRYDEIDRSEPPRHFAALVDAGHDVGLVRHGDRHAADAGPAHRLERAGTPPGAPRRRRNATRPRVRVRRTRWRGGAATGMGHRASDDADDGDGGVRLPAHAVHG